MSRSDRPPSRPTPLRPPAARMASFALFLRRFTPFVGCFFLRRYRRTGFLLLSVRQTPLNSKVNCEIGIGAARLAGFDHRQEISFPRQMHGNLINGTADSPYFCLCFLGTFGGNFRSHDAHGGKGIYCILRATIFEYKISDSV